MGVFIKFKILEKINLAGKMKCKSIALFINDFKATETDFLRNTLKIETKTNMFKFNDVILKSLEIINENGVKI